MLKKSLLTLGAIIAVLVGIAGVLGYQTFGIGSSMTDGADVGGAQAVVDGIVQAFILDAGDGRVVLIDAGVDPEAKAIHAALGRRGRGADSVAAIFLTHAHEDHAAGVAAFPNAAVYVDEAELGLIDGRMPSRAPARFILPAGKGPRPRVTDLLVDGQVVTVGALRVQLLHTPGHTDGSACFLANGVLFLGDNAVATKRGTVAPAPWLFSNDTEQNRRSLAALATRLAPRKTEVHAMAFAHSGALRGLDPLEAFARAGR